MNWALAAINEVNYAEHILDSAKAHGVRIMQWAPREGPYETTFDSALIYHRYSNASWLRFEAEGDTILYQWNTFYFPCSPPSPVAPGVMVGRFVRHPDTLSGRAMYDPAADNDTAWYFDPAVDGNADSIYAEISELNRYRGGPFSFVFNIRADLSGCNGEVLKLIVRGDRRSDAPCSPDIFTLYEVPITCDSFPPGGGYKTFEVSHRQGFGGSFLPTVKWNGAVPVWVDWIGVRDKAGLLLKETPVGRQEVSSYINRYSFGLDPGIVGFFMMEELWHDPNVIPQAIVDTLIEDAPGDLVPFTQHHHLFWWGDSTVYGADGRRPQYGGRDAISARLQPGTATSTLLYIYDGYHLERIKEPKHSPFPVSGSGVDTVLGVVANDDCITSGDTAVCLQIVMDKLAKTLFMYSVRRQTSRTS